MTVELQWIKVLMAKWGVTMACPAVNQSCQRSMSKSKSIRTVYIRKYSMTWCQNTSWYRFLSFFCDKDIAKPKETVTWVQAASDFFRKQLWNLCSMLSRCLIAKSNVFPIHSSLLILLVWFSLCKSTYCLSIVRGILRTGISLSPTASLNYGYDK